MDSNWLLADDKEDFDAVLPPTVKQRSGTITLQGNLFNTNLAELFLTITNSQMSGSLYITQGKKEKVLVFNEQGVIIKSNPICNPRPKFGETLIKMGRIGMEHLTYALDLQSKAPQLIGQILLQLNYVQLEEIQQVIQHQIRSELLELFQWQRADFQFYQGQDESEHPEIVEHLRGVTFDTRKYVIDLADKFQTLSRVRNLGTLNIQGDKNGEPHAMLIHFGNNQISLRNLGKRPILFGNRLIELKLVNQTQLENALRIQEQAILNSSQAEYENNQLHLGQILFEQGLISQEQVKEVLFYQVEQDFKEALNWSNLAFYYHPEERFEDFSERDPHLINIPFDPFAFAVKAFTITDQWVEIYKIIPNAREILPIKSGLIIDVNNIRLDISLEQIKAAINRRFDVEAIQRSVPELSGFELTVVLSHLTRDSIEEIVDELRQLAKLYHINSIFSKEAKTLELISILLPKDIESRVQLAETFEKLDPVYAAQLYLQLSQYHHESEEIKKFLNRAASLDPNNPDVTDYLIQGLIRTGEYDLAIQSGQEFFYSLVDRKNIERAESIANYFIQANVGVEVFYQLLIDYSEKSNNLQRAIREYEALIRYLRRSAGNEEAIQKAQKKIIDLEDRILSLNVRKETLKIVKPKKKPSLFKWIFILVFLAVGGYGGWIYLAPYLNPELSNNNGVDPLTNNANIVQAMKDASELLAKIEDIQSKENFDLVAKVCLELQEVVKILPEKQRTTYENAAEEHKKNAKQNQILLAEERTKLVQINKFDSNSIEIFKHYIETTPFQRLKKEATEVLEALQKREQDGKEKVQVIQKLLQEKQFRDAYELTDAVKHDVDLEKTSAIKALQYFVVIETIPQSFKIQIKYDQQPFGETPYIAYLENKIDSFSPDKIQVGPGFAPLVPIRENPLSPTPEEIWSRKFEASRKVLWSFRGEGSFRAPAFVNKANNAIAIGDTSGNFYIILNGKESYRFNIERGLDKDINTLCLFLDEKYFFVSRDKNLYAIDPSNPKDNGVLWKAKLKNDSPGVLEDGKMLYVFDNGIRAFNTKGDEDRGWKDAGSGNCFTSPVIEGNEIFCVLEHNDKIALVVYDKLERKPKFRKVIAPKFSSRENYGNIYLHPEQKRLFITNRSGEIISYYYIQKRSGAPIEFANAIENPCFLENEIIVACQDGILYSYDYKPSLNWKIEAFEPGTKFTCTPITKGDYVFVSTDDNRVYAINYKLQRIEWYYAAKERVNALQIHGSWLILSGDKAKGEQLFVLDISDIK